MSRPRWQAIRRVPVVDTSGILDTVEFVLTRDRLDDRGIKVYFMNFIPYASSFTAFTSGLFDGGLCDLDFAMSNGFGVVETPYLTKPSTYPAFLAPNCSLADPSHQWGIWADVNDIIAKISCTVPAQRSSWGEIKALYK